MSGKFQQKSSSIILTILIGLIIVSFMFTGYESMRGTPDTVAKVGSQSIKYAEYQNEFNRLSQMYSNYMFGGKPLSAEQVKSMRLKENALKSLVTGKLLQKFGERLGSVPGPQEIKDTIKELPYFQTNGQFDVSRYKLLLQSNRYTPQDFEENIKNSISRQAIQQVFTNFPVSDTFVLELEKIKSKSFSLDLIKFKKSDLVKFIKVSKKEINDFLKTEDNLNRVTSIFNSRKSTLDQKEQAKVKHILLSTQSKDVKTKDIEEKALKLKKEISTSNFSKLAKKYSDDPGSKDKGGELEWFSKGRMVPEFEKAVFEGKVGAIVGPIKSQYGFHIIYILDKKDAVEAKLEDHKTKITKELIQSSKDSELKELTTRLSTEWKDLLNKGKLKKLSRSLKKYELTLNQNLTLNRLDGLSDGHNLKSEHVNTIFANYEKNNNITLLFDDVVEVNIIKLAHQSNLDQKNKKDDNKEDPLQAQKMSLSSNYSRNLNQEVLKMMEEKIKVKIYEKLL